MARQDYDRNAASRINNNRHTSSAQRLLDVDPIRRGSLIDNLSFQRPDFFKSDPTVFPRGAWDRMHARAGFISREDIAEAKKPTKSDQVWDSSMSHGGQKYSEAKAQRRGELAENARWKQNEIRANAVMAARKETHAQRQQHAEHAAGVRRNIGRGVAGTVVAGLAGASKYVDDAALNGQDEVNDAQVERRRKAADLGPVKGQYNTQLNRWAGGEPKKSDTKVVTDADVREKEDVDKMKKMSSTTKSLVESKGKSK